MSKLTQSLVKDMPPYLDMIEQKPSEDPEQVKSRIFERINNYNGGNKDECV